MYMNLQSPEWTCLRPPLDERVPGLTDGPSCARLSPLWRDTAWGESPASYPFLHRLPLLSAAFPLPHRDNQAHVKTTCSFDSYQLISDPIRPQSPIVCPSKCIKSACAEERGGGDVLFILPINPYIPATVAMAWGQRS